MKNKKGLIFALIILMSVGFAAVTTTLIINGKTTIAENEEDYQVYFSGAVVDKEDYTNEIISKDKKTITFETKELMKENDTSELKYDVTNGSTQYDASVSIKVSKENDDLIEVTNTYDDSKNLSARETRTGVLTVRLKKGATEAKDVKIKVELIFNAEEREEIDNTPITSKVYSISGYFVDKEGNAMPNANIAVFSENPQFVTTDDYGYFYVGNLERGNHELYYIEKTDVNKTKEEIKKNAIDQTNVTTSSTRTIVFDNGHEIKDKVVGEENNKTFKITLVKNNGEADEEIEVRENSKYENLPTPKKVGTKFLYWKDENGKIITENTIVSQTKTNKLYAYYGENTYRIAYNLNGGILNNQVTQAKYGIEITLENPSKTIKVTVNDNNEGSTISENEISKILTFKGWSGKDISGTAVSNGAPWNGSIIKATTFKNLTDEQDKTVTLEANFEDTTITLPEVTKNGYTCKIKDGETTYEPSATYPIKGTDTNKELTVECGANTYTITYNANGGTGSMDATTCTYDKDCTLRANTLTKTGYTFDHWEVNANTYKNQATVKNLVESGNVELKAVWKANTYKIAYNLNGGISSNTPTGATYDKDVTIANPTKEVTVTIDGNNQGAMLTKTSYTGNPVFTGWTGSSLSNTALANNVSWNGTLTKETKFKNLTSTLNGTVTLTANYNETSVTLDTPTKTGYTCGYTDTAAGSIKYTTSITVSDNKTIYVKCNPNTYTVSYNPNGGTGSMDATTCTYDKDCTLRANTFAKTGYTFDHWEVNANTYKNQATVKNLVESGNVELKAVWKANTYKIAYNLNGGISSNTPTGATYDKDVTIANPTKEVTVTIDGNNQGATLVKTSYTGNPAFTGWTGTNLSNTSLVNNISWNGTLTKETKFKNLTSELNGTVTLTANYNETSVTLDTPTKAGYTCGYTDESTGAIKYTTSITVSDNKTIYVKCNPNTYTINFDSDGGTTVSSKTATYDSKIGTLTNPTKTGYNFAGWYLETESITSESVYKYAKDITLKAKWTEATNTKYTVNYYLQTLDKKYDKATESIVYTGTTNKTVDAELKTYEGFVTPSKQTVKILADGSAKVDYYYVRKELKVTFINASTKKEVTYLYGKENQAFTNNGFTKTGYTLTGYSNTSGGSKNYEVTSTVTGEFIDKNYPSKTVYVVFTANTYKIAFNNNGGTGTMDTITCTYDKDCTLTKNTLTKTGYTFAGWSKTSDGEIQYTNGSTVKNLATSGSMTLYAKWTANTYTITYNANGGSGTMSKTTCTYDTDCTLKANAFTKTGYTFANWTKDSTTGTGYTAGSTVKNLATSGNVNMYAKWTTNTYKIAYTMNNGSLGTNKPTSASYDANVLIDNPTKNLTVTINSNNQGATISKTSVSQAQTFNGWTVSGLNTNTAKTGTSSSAVTTAYTGSSTKNTYFKNLTATNNGTVTFTANWTNTAVTLPTITKTGYTCGYADTATGAIKYASGSKYTPNGETSKTLYAKCNANTYTITYNANGGSGTMSKTTCTYDANCTIAANSFTRTGYTFASWTKDSTTGTSYTAGSTVKNLATSGNVNMYAKWTTNTYKISYTMNNGSLGTNKPTSANYNANVLIDNPTKNLTVTINANSQGATISKTSVSQAQTFNGWTVSGLNTSTAKTGTASNAITTAYTGTSTKNTYFKNLTATNNGTVTFTANWTNTAVTLPTITKTGYTCGYATSASGSIAYASGSKYTPSGEISKTLYAKCNANTYTITYNANGGSGTMSKTTCTYDTNCTLAANSFTYDGYEFVSWTKDSTTGTSYTAGSTVKNLATSGNINMYAKWKKRENQFGKDSWSTIAANVKSGNTIKYNVGDTKEVDLGTFGTHTVRIANKSACTNGETSETACGFVVEFADIITDHAMNSKVTTNVGGWKDSEMRTYINRTIYNALPSDLQNVITTTKVVSGHGSKSGETNFETQDKLYLLSNEEIYGDFSSSSYAKYDTSVGTSKQLDYYKKQGVTTSSYGGAIKQDNGSNSTWRLRSANSSDAYNFFLVSKYGKWFSDIAARSDGVSPAFRIASTTTPSPVSFSSDSWATIAANVREGNTSKYNVGDTKTVDLGTFGTHTVRVANKSACTNGETSETACGFVVEFADIITKQYQFNSTATNVGGWRDSEIRTYINETILNALPSDLQNVITTTRVISGHGSTSGETNFKTYDKLYLSSSEEIYGNYESLGYAKMDTSYGTSKQLDYYKNQGVTAEEYDNASKKFQGQSKSFWLRSASSTSTTKFIQCDGDWYIYDANDAVGISPAFKIS